MMKSIAKLMLWLALTVAPLMGQSTSVTLNVSDADGQAWLNGTYSANLYSPPGVPGSPYFVLGSTVAVPNQSQSGNLNGAGAAALTLTPNASVGPSGTKWQFVVCPNSSTASCFTQTVTIAGASQTVNVVAPAMRVSAGPSPNVRAYSDIETVGSYGSMYYNTISNVYKVCQQLICNGSGWGAFGSQGVLNNVTNPWVEGEGQDIDCTGLADSSTAFVAWILNGQKRKEVPGDCKIKLQVTGGIAGRISGLSGILDNVDIYGGEGAEIFFCGTGAVSNFGLEFSRSGYFRFHGFRIQPTDYTYCPGGSDVLVPLLWTNNRGGGVTSTHAELDHLRIYSTGTPHGGYTAFPTVGGWGYTAVAGNNVALIDNNPPWNNLGIHQDSSTAIVNGTPYSVTVSLAGDACCGPSPASPPNYTAGFSALVALTGCTATCNTYTLTYPLGQTNATFTHLATAACTPTLHVWSTCTVNFTGTAGTAGQFIGVSILNTQAVPNGFTLSRIAIDNVTPTNFTLSNPSFETLAASLTLAAGAFVTPDIFQWFYVQNTGVYPQFKGFRVGGFQGDANMEGASFHDSDIDGGLAPASYGFYAPDPCCAEHWTVWNVAVTDVWRGYMGSIGGYFDNLNGNSTGSEGPSNYQVYGQTGGALLNVSGCAASRLILNNPNWDGSGPLLNGYMDGAAVGGCKDVTLIEPEMAAPTIESGAYPFDLSNMGTVHFIGGYPTNVSGAAINNASNAFIGQRSAGLQAKVVGTDSIPLTDTSLSHGEKLFDTTVTALASVASQRIVIPCFKQSAAGTGTTSDCLVNFDNAVTVTKVSFQDFVAPAGCTTSPHFGIGPSGGSNTIVSELAGVALPNGNTNANSGALAVNLSAATNYAIGQSTADAGCGTHAGPGTVTIEYKMQ